MINPLILGVAVALVLAASVGVNAIVQCVKTTRSSEPEVDHRMSQEEAQQALGILRLYQYEHFQLWLNDNYGRQLIRALMAGQKYEWFPATGMDKYGCVGFTADPSVPGIFEIYVNYGQPDKGHTDDLQKLVRDVLKRM